MTRIILPTEPVMEHMRWVISQPRINKDYMVRELSAYAPLRYELIVLDFPCEALLFLHSLLELGYSREDCYTLFCRHWRGNYDDAVRSYYQEEVGL